jgi:ABC-type dipeptide/oligopeptide/nickel transport system permease component
MNGGPDEVRSPAVPATRARATFTYMVRHAPRDALIPSITVPAQDFGLLIIVAVETVFAYPGLGRMRSDRCRRRRRRCWSLRPIGRD